MFLEWLFSSTDGENVFGHSLQRYGFSPEWVLWCFFRLPGPGNIVGHCLLEYGDFSCYKLQKMSLDILYKNMAPLLNEFFGDWENVFGHSLKEYGFSGSLNQFFGVSSEDQLRISLEVYNVFKN